MYTDGELVEYLAEIRENVCSRCIERPPGGPPCAPLGKRCGIELHLPEIVKIVQAGESARIDPYIERLHSDICAHCPNQPTSQCPCPLEYLLLLTVEAVETVDRRLRGEAVGGRAE
jgi:hypothetical protein